MSPVGNLTQYYLARRVFKPILQQCYYSNGERDNYFIFELTKNEAKGLIFKFEQQTISTQRVQRVPAPSQVRAVCRDVPATLATGTLTTLRPVIPQC
jgi:hypothetical protein